MPVTMRSIIRNGTSGGPWMRQKDNFMTRKQIKEQAARYAKFVEWSEEDKTFIGRCPELMLGGVHGHDEAKVYAELCVAVEEMVELIHADGKEMPDPLDK